MTYLIPVGDRPNTGTDRAHIERHGKPACGCSLDGPYAVRGWLMAYNVCEDCARKQKRMSKWTMADLDRNWYLVPTEDNSAELCHCNKGGKPACGAVLDGGYIERPYKDGYPVCEACWYGRADGGQMGLFAEAGT